MVRRAISMKQVIINTEIIHWELQPNRMLYFYIIAMLIQRKRIVFFSYEISKVTDFDCNHITNDTSPMCTFVHKRTIKHQCVSLRIEYHMHFYKREMITI